MRLGIDLGGTKTEIIAIDDQGRELLRERTPTPAQSYEEILKLIGELVLSAEARLGVSATLGIGIPGAPSVKTGLIKNANTVCLIGKPLQRDLEKVLQREVRLANDANCFALSEASDGAGAGAQSVFGVILGTGTGGGIVIGGRVVDGFNAIAGEWGHNPLPWPTDGERPGRACYCGKFGCIETFLSGPGLRADHFLVSKQDIASEQIVALALGGAPAAEATLLRYEERLAKSLASVINIFDPEVVVLGGGLSNVSRFYENVPKIWSKYAFSDGIETRLVKAAHGDSSGVRGRLGFGRINKH